jgi:hypothetical protein
MAETDAPFGTGPFGQGPFGPKPAGGQNFTKTVTANIDVASPAIVKSVGKNVIAAIDAAAAQGAKAISFAVAAPIDASVTVTKAVAFAVTALFDCAGLAVKNVGKPIAATSIAAAGSIVRDVGKNVVSNVTAGVSALLATLFIVSRNILMDPINCVLAGHQRFFDRLREYDIRPRNLRQNTVGKTAGTRRIGGDKSTFRVRTDKRGYD